METTEQKRCDNCIHYIKVFRRSGWCKTNVNEIFKTPLFDKDNKEIVFHITTKCSNYCGLHEIKTASN